MTKAKSANQMGLPSCWKVRICLRGGAVIYALSATEPEVLPAVRGLAHIDAEWITGTEHGDTLGHLDLTEVAAVTWRFAPGKD